LRASLGRAFLTNRLHGLVRFAFRPLLWGRRTFMENATTDQCNAARVDRRLGGIPWVSQKLK
jgi:hypothetical protein